MGSVQISNVQKRYGSTEVLHDIAVDIPDGEFVVLVGPSGCGKSTLLRMIAGLETITAGDIAINSRVVNNVAPKQRDIAMVFQNYALYPHMHVADNMGFALKLAGASKQEIRERVAGAARILGLSDLLTRFPRQLSGGQRQRVAMGRAIVRDPQVFLFDEPLSNLDAKLRVSMRAEIKNLHQRLQTTMIYVTHDQIEAMTMADRIVVMNSGRVEQVGSPLELYDYPANIFVAGFIGSPAMNFLEGEAVKRPGAKTTFRSAAGSSLPAQDLDGIADGTAMICGIRPEDFVLDDNGMPFEVSVVEPTGSETQVLGSIGDVDVVGVFRERLRARPGEVIHVSAAPEKLHFFDPATQQRLVPAGERDGETRDH